MLTVRTTAIYASLSLSSLSMVPRNSQRIACSFNRPGSEAGLGVGFSEDTRSLLLPQARLVFSSSFTDTELSGSCWSSSGEAKSGFPANFQEPRVSLPRMSQRRGRSILPTTTLAGFFAEVRPVTPLSSFTKIRTCNTRRVKKIPKTNVHVTVHLLRFKLHRPLVGIVTNKKNSNIFERYVAYVDIRTRKSHWYAPASCWNTTCNPLVLRMRS